MLCTQTWTRSPPQSTMWIKIFAWHFRMVNKGAEGARWCELPQTGTELLVLCVMVRAIRYTSLIHRKGFCRDPGMNRGPLDLQSDALPTELSRLYMQHRARPSTHAFTVTFAHEIRSINWLWGHAVLKGEATSFPSDGARSKFSISTRITNERQPGNDMILKPVPLSFLCHIKLFLRKSKKGDNVSKKQEWPKGRPPYCLMGDTFVSPIRQPPMSNG